MDELEELANLKRRYEDAQSAEKANKYAQIIGGVANNMANNPSMAARMGWSHANERMDFTPPDLSPKESTASILNKYDQMKAAKQARELELSDRADQRAYSEQMADKQFGRQKELAQANFERDKELAGYKALLNRYGKGGTVGGIDREKYVPGLGETLTAQDAKDLKTGMEEKAKFDRQLQDMIDLRKKYGAETLNREAVAKGKQLSKDLLLTYKNMAKLGVLSKSDQDIVEAIVPADPLEWNASSLIGQDPTLAVLEKFSNDTNKDFEARIKARTLNPDQAVASFQQGKMDQKLQRLSPEDQQAVQWAMQNPDAPESAGILQANGFEQPRMMGRR